MYEIISKKLLKFRNRTITLQQLEGLFNNLTTTYEEFGKQILELENMDVLSMIKAGGRNNRKPSIANRYRINKNLLNKSYHQELQMYRLKLNNKIHLDSYYKLNQSVWEHDLPYLKKINDYLEQHGFPDEKVPAPERSFALVGDEKWLIEGNGSTVLRRIHLWDEMNIMPVSDPLMLAINPKRINKQTHLHLIVENKTTYQGLLPVIKETVFSTLIYGQGNEITKTIENFSNQYPVTGEHYFFYFGDLDRSGITIWNSLNKRQHAYIAIPFYLACLEKQSVYGKTNQQRNQAAIEAFLSHFDEVSQTTIQSLLDEGAYYPQEVLKMKELQQIWRDYEWKELI